jgi:hypothetical protein
MNANNATAIVATEATLSFRSTNLFLRRARSYLTQIFVARATHHDGAYRMLNRNAICSGAYLDSFDSLPGEMLWSLAQIDASLAQTLRQRPSDGDVWVFAYGSLMWNPISEFDCRRIATLHGWHRSFCIRLIAGRGTPEQPGRMLALEPGGSTQGVALRLSSELGIRHARRRHPGVGYRLRCGTREFAIRRRFAGLGDCAVNGRCHGAVRHECRVCFQAAKRIGGLQSDRFLYR